jgi:hypothetical protein
MATVELLGSRKGRASHDYTSRMVYQYKVCGVDSEAAAVAAAATAAPLTVIDPANLMTLYRDDVEWEQEGPDIWRVDFTFCDPQQQEPNLQTGEYRVQFSTQGGSVHVTNSLETIKTYTEFLPPIDGGIHDRAIGVNESGEIEGCDVVVPALKFSITYRQPRAVITDAYVRFLEAITGTTNADTFKGRAAGEVLFLGADGAQGTNSDPEITYHFARSPNITGAVIGAITGISKTGWAYLWVEYRDSEHAAPHQLTKLVHAVHVERLYNPSTFSALGI